MSAFTKLLLTRIGPDRFSAYAAQWFLFVCGLMVIVGGILRLPSLRLNEPQLFIALFLLITVMLLCVAVGLLLPIADDLKAIRKQQSM